MHILIICRYLSKVKSKKIKTYQIGKKKGILTSGLLFQMVKLYALLKRHAIGGGKNLDEKEILLQFL